MKDLYDFARNVCEAAEKLCEQKGLGLIVKLEDHEPSAEEICLYIADKGYGTFTEVNSVEATPL